MDCGAYVTDCSRSGATGAVTDEGRGEIDIRAGRRRVWEVVTAFEAYPVWAGDIKHVAVLDARDDGLARTVEYRVGGFGVTVGYTLAYRYGPPEWIRWELVRSNELRRMDGTYRLTDLGPGLTQVEYHLMVDLKIPVIAMIRRRAEKLIIHHALSGLKAHVEEAAADGTDVT